MKMFEVKELSFTYNGSSNKLLDKVTFNLEKGNVLYVLGRNGSGKSTLLKLISGLLSPLSGEILFEGKHIKELLKQRKINIGYIPTNPEIFFTGTTIEEEICINRSYFGPESDLASTVIGELFEYDRIIESMSSGEKYRLAFALALWKEPDILLLDEPFALLHYPMRIELTKYLLNLQKRKKFIIIWATHRVEEIFYKRDKILYLYGDGRWLLK